MTDRYVKDGTAGSASPYTSWATAATTVNQALLACSPGDRIFVDKTHSETSASSVDWSFPANSHNDPVLVYSVTNTGVAPVPADYAKMADSTGQIEVTGSTNFLRISDTDAGAAFHGLKFNLPSGSFNQLRFYSNSSQMAMIQCHFRCGSIQYSPGANTHWLLDDCDFEFLTASHALALSASGMSKLTIRNCRHVASATPNEFIFTTSSANALHLCIDGLDVSGCSHASFEFMSFANIDGATNREGTIFEFRNILLPTGKSLGNPAINALTTYLHAIGCGDGDQFHAIDYRTFTGTLLDDTANHRNADRGDGTKFSMAFTGSANAVEGARGHQCVRYPIARFYSTANPTVKVHGYGDHATVWTNKKFWIEVEYPDATNQALTKIATTAHGAFDFGTGTNISTGGTAGDWTKSPAPTNARYYDPSITVSGGGEGLHRVFACVAAGASETIYVDPALDLS